MSDVDPLLRRPLVPIANVEDAITTAETALPHIAAAGGRATVVHVIEKGGGVPDKASVEQREELAEAAFDRIRAAAEDVGVDIETELHYGTDVGASILDAAHDADATAIAFTPRGGRAWWAIFSDSVRKTLTTESDLPVVVFPNLESEDADTSDQAGDGDDSRGEGA
ncbi:MAG: universal stress protein [Halobellus sp.]|uniref:universal stress protein n=1 Tax=Halobellus sp. TaxID=1979212 RepID=UPI0035D48A0E